MTVSSTAGTPSLLGILEELGDDEVLVVRRQLDDAVRVGDADAVIGQEAQRVVLVGGEAAHGADRRLVLELAVEDRATDAVPAVGALVTRRVDLAEQAGSVVERHAQRRRTAGALEAERLDVDHGQAELVGHRPHDRGAAFAAEIEVRVDGAAPVRHRERLLRGEPAEHHRRRRRRPARWRRRSADRGVGAEVHRRATMTTPSTLTRRRRGGDAGADRVV